MRTDGYLFRQVTYDDIKDFFMYYFSNNTEISVYVTFAWVRSRIKHMMREKDVIKVAFADTSNIFKKFDGADKVLIKEKMDEGYGLMLVAVDKNNEVVGDVVFVRNKNDTLDPMVEELMGKEKMVVVEE